MNISYVQKIKLHQKTISNLFISLYKTLLIQIIISRGLKMLDRASQENFSYFINCEWYLPFFLSPFLRFFLWKRNIPHFHYASSSIRLCRVLRKEISTYKRILNSIYFVYNFIKLNNNWWLFVIFIKLFINIRLKSTLKWRYLNFIKVFAIASNIV